MSIVVGVQFKKEGKVYYFDPGKYKLNKGDGVIVDTARGKEYVTVVFGNTDIPKEEIKGELKLVCRKASQKDTETYQNNLARRAPAIKEAQEMANKRKLEMKFVDAEFSFEGNKAVFFFTADNRIDFRDLVKEMANKFHARIELRQIGIRDECKMKGGLGPCGRVCCCHLCQTEFAHVSIKMAKHQGLSLNPTNISGLCGRLMCCLKFEEDYYAQTTKFMPKINSEIKTPDGTGKVEAIDILHQTVRVRVSVPNSDDTALNTYTLEQLGITPVYQGQSAENTTDGDDEDSLTDSDIID